MLADIRTSCRALRGNRVALNRRNLSFYVTLKAYEYMNMRFISSIKGNL